ncbi:MAG: sulfite exporter TauE/SafE family protein [Phycisphaerae bacterium]|nr:sulfite exporter TauE/SafE family protein [Phycisphaerae bacterium]
MSASLVASDVALLSTTLVASLLGSLHCAGMCGGIVACTTATQSTAGPRDIALTTSIGGSRRTLRSARVWSAQSAYHGGRLVSYAALGAVAGTLGGALDLGGALVGVQRVASALAGCTIVLLGAVMLLRLAGARIPHAMMPGLVIRAFQALHRRAMAMPPVTRSLAIGLATPLLPCGWLYAFVAIAAGAATTTGGALIMSAFWLGSVPALAAVAIGVRAAAGPLRSALPVVAAVVMIAMGLHIAFVRGPKAAAVASSMHPLAGSAAMPSAILHVADELPACCSGANP